MDVNVNSLLELYEQAKQLRSQRESDWKRAALFCYPKQYSMWNTEAPVNQTGGNSHQQTRKLVYDTTGMRALPKFVSILSRMATPRSQKWHMLQAADPDLNKRDSVKEYFDKLNSRLFKLRYDTRAHFERASTEMYGQFGAYGSAPIYIGMSTPTPVSMDKTYNYKACPLRDVYVLADDDGNYVQVFRRMQMNARQFVLRFKNTTPPPSIQAELKKDVPDELSMFEVFHVVWVKDMDEYDPEAPIGDKRFPVGSAYVAVKDRQLIGKAGGHLSMPYLIPRADSEAGDPYGYSPAMRALSSMATASAIKRSYLKQAQRAVDQVLLAHNDAIVNGRIDLTPGKVNFGGVDSQGRRLIQALEPGNMQLAEKLLEDERRDVDDSFFVLLFDILIEKAEMTATEVIERSAEKASLLAPTMGHLQTEWLGPLISRELDLLVEMGQLPPDIPPELAETQLEHEVVYTSPMARGEYAEEIGGFIRSVQIAGEASSYKQDIEPLDHFDFDTAIREMADHLAVPQSWLRTVEEVAKVREQRAAQIEAQQTMEALPALTGAVKAAGEMQEV